MAAAVWRGYVNRSRMRTAAPASACIGIADAHRDHRDVVGLGTGEEAGRSWRERVTDGRAHRQRLVDHVDEAERILGDVAVVGHDEGHRLAHVADRAARDGGLQIALRSRRRRAHDSG